ncbi:bifunctional molybdenum cofactor guanylyltransferase MobA/molybdopterin-guanine dinucleotide biosynthesis adaptor protein MobB [Chlorobaculum sp. MV4-Y]|uniref:bifunctional molybdenum cofactor guanylyltransferase MobA/molybdopterin-guanine dinucleotide biosynthesis adaptor protein MobB n=1 Tax=Chlorobaculum sp. MV4-Y TaxID=2976335 RepID=UPI0021AF3A1F|nr:bifunctional molybdenum cofactor guanylyltransferase MobA/molybdopterin-guanine dinucleotide biosynthesis adaptor protein MobB [Chlorobaculum sp. MV4-Y]UWX58296.1 bifunctional molybdenum cofactor guanylyltransferase MobA/molybdopterin-guanine dinucleotide biosynthesis adaptor protein MobB [Chlorobaculum sp. MV4-Y]
MFHPFEIALCGLSGSGKTTLVEKLIRHFSAYGFEVAAVKHGCHRFEIDREGKDSDRFRKAGAVPVLIADREKEVLISQGTGRLDIAGSTLDADLLFIEGLKELPVPKLLLIDERRKMLPLLETGAIPQVLALVHDGNSNGLERFSLSLFQRDDVTGISDFIAEFFSRTAKSLPLNGLVLAGGRSSRMGRDKAQLRYHGASQLEHMATLLGSVCNEVFVSCRSEQLGSYAEAGLPAIADSYLDLGPLGGLLSAQRQAPGAAWLVAACDLPFIDEAVIAALQATRNPYRFATAFAGDKGCPEPLFTIYEPKSRRRLLESHAAGNDSLRSFLMHSRVELIELDDTSKLCNVNDPAAMDEALRAIGRGGE